MSRKKIIIIGAGVAGLAASIRCAKMGFETIVYESNSFPGGKINSQQLGNYRFDRGPSIFTAPEYLEELFNLCDADYSSFKYADVSVPFHYFFNDGTTIELSTSPNEIIHELHEKLGEPKDKIQHYLSKAEKNYQTIAPLFIEKSLHNFRSLLGADLLKALVRIPSYKLFSTMHEENEQFFSNPKTHQIFNRFASYNGSHPYKAPAMLNMISHLEINHAPFLPQRGMIQITEALFDLAKQQGVQFNFNQHVEQILTEKDSVTGIRVGQSTVKCDAVISNMDATFTYEKLLPTQAKPEKTIKQERSSSAIVFYWGMNTTFPELSLHNVFFSDDYKSEFDGIFNEFKLTDDATVYVNITSKFVEGDAPEGCENWFVMLNAPIDSGQDWEQEVKRIRACTIKKLSAILGKDISTFIEEEDILTPPIIEQLYSGKHGSIYGNASNNRYAAFYRHPNYSKQVNDLYFAGVSVHPGGGIPLALNSAKLACQFLAKKHQH